MDPPGMVACLLRYCSEPDELFLCSANGRITMCLLFVYLFVYVLFQFNEIVTDLSYDEKVVRLVTENALHLRQCLHPRAFQQNTQLPGIFYKYFDIRKEYKVFREKSKIFKNLREIAEGIYIIICSSFVCLHGRQFLHRPQNFPSSYCANVNLRVQCLTCIFRTFILRHVFNRVWAIICAINSSARFFVLNYFPQPVQALR